MKSVLKKIAAVLIAAAILTTGFVLPVTAERGDTVLSISFDDAENDTAYTVRSGASLVDGRNGKALKTANNTAADANSYAAINDVAAINGLAGDFTISVWCCPNDTTMWTRLFDIGTGTDKYMFLTPSNGFKEGYPRFAIKNGKDEEIIDSDLILNIGKWNNITITRESGLMTMYINGCRAGSNVILTSPWDLGTTTQNYIGKSQFPDPYFNGMIDDFKVYNYAMSADEVYENSGKLSYEDKYEVRADFYNTESEKLLVLNGEKSVKSVINIENNNRFDDNVAVKMYSHFGENTVELAKQELTAIATGNSLQVTLTGEVPSDCDYISVVVESDNLKQQFDCGYLVKSDIELPSKPTAYAAESDNPAFGAHDPSIFKDPVTGHYFAYSSHNVIFESEDLINWEKHDYNGTISVPQKCADFITDNSVYQGSAVNGTYWAPDMLYVADDEHPYWFYVSVSCGIGGRSSVIGLVKSDSPRIWDGECVDEGVVMASVEADGYKTNSIDANIYTDTDGKNYFIWGSFWQGIQAAPLTADGRVEGVDYTSDATILESCKNFGTDLMSVKNGVVGPEGPWLTTNTEKGFRYLFTSYGWLGTNYNIRIARSELSNSVGNIISQKDRTAFKDHNSNQVANGYTDGSETETWGYKLIGAYQLGDGIIYYGNGHNSVLNDNGEWYLVDHVRKVADAGAFLQVRKMLWTESGWPVVSPLGYTGEKVQKLDEMMLYGTWDLASVGQTLKDSANITYKGSDLPVKSSEIVLMPDGKLGGGLGEWSFDKDHTVTLKFVCDGDEDKNQYFKAGDIMTMYALTGYDTDKSEYAVVMTGVDENAIAQFAKKSNANACDMLVKRNTKPIVLEKSKNGNPILGFDANGSIMYAGDPAATVVGDTVYLYAGHDVAETTGYSMPEWVLYTSKNMVDWEYKGVVMEAKNISWASNATSAWASQMVKYGEKYYLYFCTWNKNDSGKQSIGVAVADSPEGPFEDIGKPLVSGSVTTPQTSDWNDIDPTVWIETVGGEEHRYLAWGNGILYTCELNEDMVSVKDTNSDNVINMSDIKQITINDMNGASFTEAPWLYKRGNTYYNFFAVNWREAMAYATAENIYGPWTYKGLLMEPTATSNTNHPSVIDFNGKTYFIYHNGALPNGSGFRRSICVEELHFDGEGNVYPLTETSIGVSGKSSPIISYDGGYVGHSEFINSYSDNAYPIKKDIVITEENNGLNSEWEIKESLADLGEEYVSIQAVNKPGLYIGVRDGELMLTQDDTGTMGRAMSFRTVEGINGKGGVSFESAAQPGKYLTVYDGKLILSCGNDADKCTFGAGKVCPTQNEQSAPVPDIGGSVYCNFDDLRKETLINVLENAQEALTSINGVKLYVGTNTENADETTGFAIEDGGVSGNALVMNSGAKVSGCTGPRMAIDTPYISENGDASVSFKVKADSRGILRYNDSVVNDSGRVLPIRANEWNDLEIIIRNEDGGFERTIAVNGEIVVEDYARTMPVIWGTQADNTGAKLYFDDFAFSTGYIIVDGCNVTVNSRLENMDIYAVKYDSETGILTGIEIFDASEKEVVTTFKPDKVFVWSDKLKPHLRWKKSISDN